MQAVVGSEMPFASGCEPMKVLAGLDVPAKAPSIRRAFWLRWRLTWFYLNPA
jgi:hypothetical protein